LLVPIRGGARLSGKSGGFNIGALNIQTDDKGSRPADNASVCVSRELPSRSGVGAMFVNRIATGRLATPGDWNRTWGADGRLGVGERITLSGFAARTETPELTGRDYAYNVDSEYDDGRHLMNVEHGVTGEDFNPELGYLDKDDGYRRFYIRFQETMRQERIRSWGFREFLPHVFYRRHDYLPPHRAGVGGGGPGGNDGGLQGAELHIDNHWDWENGNYISTAVNGTWDGLPVPFQVYPGIIVPPGDHGGLRFTLRANTDRRTTIQRASTASGPSTAPSLSNMRASSIS
jgi:hypothetical protein